MNHAYSQKIRSKHHGLAHIFRVSALADQLSKATHFTTEECKHLILLHNRLESVGPLNRLRMREVLHVIFEITDDVMLDLAFNAFDKDGDNLVDDVEFIRGLSIMLRGTTDELSEWCYYIYDMNGDGGLAREELTHCLKGCIVPGYGIDPDEAEESERDIVEIAMRKLDVDRDGQITLIDFKRAVKKDPLLLVSVGPCLPPVRCCAAFLSLITEKFRSYTGALGRASKHSTNKSHVQLQSQYKRISGPSQYQAFTGPAFNYEAIGVPTSPKSEMINNAAKQNSFMKAKTLSVSIVGTLTPEMLEHLKQGTTYFS